MADAVKALLDRQVAAGTIAGAVGTRGKTLDIRWVPKRGQRTPWGREPDNQKQDRQCERYGQTSMCPFQDPHTKNVGLSVRIRQG